MKNPIDLTGQRFGRLVVIEKAGNNKEGRAMWLCRCSCGNERIILGKSLRNGHTQSCGCLNKEINSERSLINRVGQRFGRLVVEERAQDYIAKNGNHHVMWRCRCDCGNTTIADSCQLSSGKTKSCGCLKNDVSSETHTKHGGRRDRLYKVWANMKNRCFNSNSSDYKYYGGRGIRVCDEWTHDYNAFKEWAYSSGYDDSAEKGQCTIDRIDVDGNYEPSNCRWVSMSIQSRNRRNVISNDKCSRKNNARVEAEIGGTTS